MVRSLEVRRWKIILARTFGRVNPHSSGVVLLHGSIGFPHYPKAELSWETFPVK